MYQSDNCMFRSLTDDEEAVFRTYAQENEPSNTDWNLFHPICRDEWRKRGLRPLTDESAYKPENGFRG